MGRGHKAGDTAMMEYPDHPGPLVQGDLIVIEVNGYAAPHSRVQGAWVKLM